MMAMSSDEEAYGEWIKASVPHINLWLFDGRRRVVLYFRVVFA